MVMNEENRKKILIGSIIGVVTLVIVVVGATYAFFSLNVSGDVTNTNVDIETGNADVVTIEQGAENMHINLAVSDMAEDNPNKAYYATTVDSENYKLNEGDGTLTFATVTGTNKESSDCTAKVTITMDTSNDSMGKVLQKGDAILYITSGKTEETVDLYDLLSEEIPASVTKEIEVELSVSEDAEASIAGYLKVNNTESDQSYLAGKTLNITITVDNLLCGVNNDDKVIELLQEKGKATFKEESGMYRFVGTKDEVLNNYICFGTDDTNTCLETPENYMYRIIGVTSSDDEDLGLKANQLKLIKATRQDSRQWNINYYASITWDASPMQTYLNTTFLEAVKWESPDKWKGLISSQKWYSGEYITITPGFPEPRSGMTKTYKIGLMYATDYVNAYQDKSTDNWLLLQNGWIGNSGQYSEWTMSRYGRNGSCYATWFVQTGEKGLGRGCYTSSNAVRPVFYVSPNVTLTGEGNTDDPFIIHSL